MDAIKCFPQPIVGGGKGGHLLLHCDVGFFLTCRPAFWFCHVRWIGIAFNIIFCGLRWRGGRIFRLRASENSS